MTIRIPPKNDFWGDRILARLGKKRCLILPDPSETGPYGVHMAHWEGFWSALFRSKAAPLPNGSADGEDLFE